MKTKLKQIYYEMRHQPVIAWVTFLATALSVFLIIVVLMMQRVQTVPFQPESCRDHLLLGLYLHVESTNNSGNSSSGAMSYHAAKTLYDGLDGVEHTSYFSSWNEDKEVSAPEGDTYTVSARKADAGFFDVFDHELVEGRIYTPEEAEARMPLTVITESVAKNTLGEAPWCGRDIVINHKLYTVTGVVRDHSALATNASGDVFLPVSSSDTEGEWGGYMGKLAVAVVVKDGVDFDYVRDQVRGRYAMLDAEMAADSMRTVYHGAPFDQQTIADATHFGSNTTPDTSSGPRHRFIIYSILLLVPAINLSSMLHSRMRRRINEIGVRRAYGCTRSRIITDIITENLIVTLAGGIVGITLGIIFAGCYSGLYESMDNSGANHNLTPAMSALLNWGTIFISLGICFILNLLSASVPAWQASRLNPVQALNSK